MITSPPKSWERIGFASTAVLTLAPVFFHAVWPLIALNTGVKCDAHHLTWASLGVAGGVVLSYVLFYQRILLGSIVVSSSIGLGMAVILGKDFKSKLLLALVWLCLAVLVSISMRWIMVRLPVDWDGLAKQHKIKTALFVLLATFSVVQTSHLSTFMGDATRVEHSTFPSIPFLVKHSCFTAYVHAFKLAKAREKNLYDTAHWPDHTAHDKVNAIDAVKMKPYAPFVLDLYMYPPQFLLVPAVLDTVSSDFLIQRALWFGLSALLLVVGFWMVAMWFGENGRWGVFWLIPLFWSTALVLATLQIGNVHHGVIVMAVLGMLAFEYKKPALGGALLSFAILSKISPALLGLVLLVQRRWRDAAWTFAFGIMFTLLTVVVVGIQPIESFLRYELPRLSSGAAMSWFKDSVREVMANFSPFGIPFKLSLLGVKFENAWGLARIINSLYTLCIVGLTVFLALQHRDRSQKMYLWLGVLALSTLQSPFAPIYVIFPVYLVLLLLATEIKNVAGIVAIVLAWIILSIPLTGSQTTTVLISFLQQVIAFGVLLFALLYKPVTTDAANIAGSEQNLSFQEQAAQSNITVERH